MDNNGHNADPIEVARKLALQEGVKLGVDQVLKDLAVQLSRVALIDDPRFAQAIEAGLRNFLSIKFGVPKSPTGLITPT